MKQLFRIMFCGMLSFIILSPTWAATPQKDTLYDYGDAPDGTSAGYGAEP